MPTGHRQNREYELQAKKNLLDLIRKYHIGFDVFSESEEELRSREDHFYKVDVLSRGQVLYAK